MIIGSPFGRSKFINYGISIPTTVQDDYFLRKAKVDNDQEMSSQKENPTQKTEVGKTKLTLRLLLILTKVSKYLK